MHKRYKLGNKQNADHNAPLVFHAGNVIDLLGKSEDFPTASRLNRSTA
jgi:hypothetical protein